MIEEVTALYPRILSGSPRPEWFRIYKVLKVWWCSNPYQAHEILQDFLLPVDAYDLIFLTSGICVVSSYGFEIMQLDECVDLYRINCPRPKLP